MNQQSKRRSWSRWVLSIAVLALTAAACGDDEPAATTAATATTAAEAPAPT